MISVKGTMMRDRPIFEVLTAVIIKSTLIECDDAQSAKGLPMFRVNAVRPF